MAVETIRYTIDGAPYEGALVYDEAATVRRPGVLMAPNWLGLNDAAIERAKLIGTGRYVVFVPDMYGVGKRPTNFDQAAELANPLRAGPAEARKRIAAALATLTAEGERRNRIDSSRLAAIGFCFGGGNVLELARSGAAVAAVVSIHGDLASPAPVGPGGIKAAVLAIHGSLDPIAPKAQRDEFEREMDAAKARWQLVTFGGLVHAFAEPFHIPGVAEHDEPATRQTYELTHAFVSGAFNGWV